MDTDIFDVLLLIGRPASGKSEIIDFLKRCPADLRRACYPLGTPDVQDDSPKLWTWFEEDDLRSRTLGRPRRLYGEDDWADLAPADAGRLKVGNLDVPYAAFENEDDVTTGKPDLLAARLWEQRRLP